MTLTDAQMMGILASGIGIIGALAKMWAAKMQSHITSLETHVKNCEEDRKFIRNRQDKNMAVISELQVKVGIIAACDEPNCAIKNILKSTQPHSSTPKG